MSTFNSDDHPRGHINNKGSFSDKPHSEPESDLSTDVSSARDAAAYIAGMSTFNEADHPRNHPTGKSRFSEKTNSEPDGGLTGQSSEFETKQRTLAAFLFKLARGEAFWTADEEEVQNYTADAEDILRANPHLLTLGERDRLGGEMPELALGASFSGEYTAEQIVDDAVDDYVNRVERPADVQTVRGIIEDAVRDALGTVPKAVDTFERTPEQITADLIAPLHFQHNAEIFNPEQLSVLIETAIRQARG